ncbi:hypothetical protein KAU32_02230 [bacterium]|nr:hypothetical protein [bacterium]
MNRIVALLLLLIMLLACENRAIDNFLDTPSYENQMKVLKSLEDDSSVVFAEETQKQRFIELVERENIYALRVSLEVIKMGKSDSKFKNYLLEYLGKLLHDKPELYQKLDICTLGQEDVKAIVLFPLERERDLVKIYYLLLPSISLSTSHFRSRDCEIEKIIDAEHEILSKRIKNSGEYKEIEEILKSFFKKSDLINKEKLFETFKKFPGYSSFYLSHSLEVIYELSDLVEEGSKHAAEVAFYILNNIELYSGAGGEEIFIMLSTYYDTNIEEFLNLAKEYRLDYDNLKTILNVYDYSMEKLLSLDDAEIYKKRLERIYSVENAKYSFIKEDVIKILTEILDK